MGKRLSKIYTKTGDSGDTGLGDGSRISKNHPRIDAIGTVDELNSVLGILVEEITAASIDELNPIGEFLRGCQHRIFDLGGELSIPGHRIIEEGHVTTIEEALDALNADLEPLQDFILPGGSRLVASCHWARSVCRRAERSLVAMGESGDVNDNGLKFLNRLSDYLFVAARWAGRQQGAEEVLWQR